MSGNAVNVIIKAMQDREYCDLLFSNKDRALGMFKLTEDEVRSLKNLDRRTYEKAVSKIEPALQKRIISGGFEEGSVRLTSRDHPVIENYDAG